MGPAHGSVDFERASEGRFLRSAWREIGFAWRSLRHRPGLVAAALLSLVLGIGTNTAVYTLIDAIFERPLPVEGLDRLVAAFGTERTDAGVFEGDFSFSHANFQKLAEDNEAFDGLAVFQWGPIHLTGIAEPVRATGMWVSANYFEVLGLDAARGRFFTAEEDETPGTHPVAVLSHAAWRRLFGADPEVVGTTARINGQPLTVIGVAPEGFRGTDLSIEVDLWFPTLMYPVIGQYAQYFDNEQVGLFRVIGRLAPGVTLAQAEAEVHRRCRAIGETIGGDYAGYGGKVRPIVEGTLRPADRTRFLGYRRLMTAAVGTVLFVACLNVAVLLLVRGRERTREIAVRRALGAGRWRTVRQLLIENLLLFVVGGLLSLPIARLTLDLLWRMRPDSLAANALDLQLDTRVLAFALLTTLATGVVFGLVPALRLSNPDLVSSLKAGGRTAVPRKWGIVGRLPSVRQLLVVAQVALALVALIGAGLFLRNLRAAYALDLGFDHQTLTSLRVAPGEQGYDTDRVAIFYDRLLSEIRAVPGVRDATLSENRLLRGGVFQSPIVREGESEQLEGGGRKLHRTNAVTPGFFATVGMPFREGTDFSSDTRADGPPVAIINQTMADIVWPGQSAVGKRFHLTNNETPKIAVVGVVEDAKYRNVHEAPQFFIYLPLVQRIPGAVSVHAAVERGDPAALLPALRSVLKRLDPSLTTTEVSPMTRFVEQALWAERISASMLSAFGALALALALIGVFGVLSYAIELQRRALGIRVAIGAQPGSLIGGVLGDAAKLIVAGIVVGLIVARLLLERIAGSQLYGVSATDLWTYLGIAALLAVVAITACLVPARKAAAADPTVLLRSD